MNRKAFLATIAAFIAAPFALKSNEITIPEADAKWLNANPELLSNYERATWKIKSSDLYVVMDRDSYKRRRIG